MKKEELKLEKYGDVEDEKSVGFRLRMKAGDHLELSDYAKRHGVSIADVIASALRQCGVLTAP